MDAAIAIVDNLLEARRKKTQKSASPTSTAPASPPAPEPSEEELSNFVMQAFPQGPMLRLQAYAEKYGISISGSVDRSNHHYVHEHSTSFTLNVEFGTEEAPPEIENWVNENVESIENDIKEKIVEINRKIYRALERENDYRLGDEAIADSIVANERTFNMNGVLDDGEIPFAELAPDAKARAIDQWRELVYADPDTFWSEHIIEEWTEELAKMGFGYGTLEKWSNRQRVQTADPDISWSGFSSQGDGASFTTNHFDFNKYVEYFVTGQDQVEGPMSDEERLAARRAAGLPESEEVDDQISRMVRDVAFNDYSQVADQVHGNSMDRHYHSRSVASDTKAWADFDLWVMGPEAGPDSVKAVLRAVAIADAPPPQNKVSDQSKREVGFYVPQGRRGELLARLVDFWDNTKGMLERRDANGQIPKGPKKLLNSMNYTLSRLAGVWKQEHTVQRREAYKTAVDKLIADDPEGFEKAAKLVRSRLPKHESEEEDMMSRITGKTMAQTFPYESFMMDISQQFWSGMKQYRWSNESQRWNIQVYATLFLEEQNQQPWEVSVTVKNISSGRKWTNDLRLATDDEKSNMGPQVKELVEHYTKFIQSTADRNDSSENRKKEWLDVASGIFNRIFRTQGALIEI